MKALRHPGHGAFDRPASANITPHDSTSEFVALSVTGLNGLTESVDEAIRAVVEDV
jgi:hypothetical protein